MSDLTQLKVTLEDLRREAKALAGKRDGIVIEQTPDALDQTQSAAERDLVVSLLNRETKTYRRVERALKRMQDGTYGVCLACDEPISAKRLRAVPWAEFCFGCQTRLDAEARGVGQQEEDADDYDLAAAHVG
jgi:DnaK suppressor protein